MIHKRLAILAAAAGLGLLSGCSGSRSTCSSTSGFSGFFGRLTGRARTVEVMPAYESGDQPCCDGPLLSDHGPVVMPSMGGVPSFPSAPGAIPGGAPLAPVPRLVPEPQPQARSYPYNP